MSKNEKKKLFGMSMTHTPNQKCHDCQMIIWSYVSGSVFWLLSRNTGTELEHINQPEFQLVTEILLSRSDLGMTSLLTSSL